MRAKITRSICLLVLPASAAGVHAAGPRASGVPTVRTVQLIDFGSFDGASAGLDPTAGEPRANVVLDAEDVLEHDRARRPVTFQTTERGHGFDEAMRSRPPASETATPTWTIAAPFPSPVTSCLANPYRPAGFLRFDAERNRMAHYPLMRSVACENGLPVALFDAMIMRESQYRPDARSPKNAFGLTQLMPGTAQALGVDRYSPEGNLRGGARYLRQQLDRFGYYHLALAAYNAGPGRIRRGRVPAIAETQAYVADVLSKWSRLTGTPQQQPYAPGQRAIASERRAEVQIF